MRTIPGRVQSYLACAKPIVAALNGEGARVVEEAGAGLTCAAENPEALAETIREVYCMTPEARRALGERGRAYYDANFDRDVLADRLESWLGENR